MSQLTAQQTPIAVVGLGCRFPGADSFDEYWRLIRDGRSGIVELGPERLDRALYYDPEPGKLGRTYSTLGGVVPDRPIDRSLCSLPQRLIDDSDPAHLIMCEVAAMACRHAGYDPLHLPLRNTGVYIGHSGGSTLAGEIAFNAAIEGVAQYLKEDKTFTSLPATTQRDVIRSIIDRVHREKASRRPDGGPELGASNVSHLIAHAFGLEGPALATDAACASSLIAMAMGIHALRNGLIDMAIVGGASCSKWYALVLFAMARSISGTGSRPFDANADGLISSDGYAAVILKTLPRAIADGDRIQTVIRGIGISSDGRGKSLWAPRKEGQILAVQRAYGTDVDPSWLQYIECHATSTQVGDSTELSALNLALKDRLPKDRKLPIGSVKANIGHTLESAGIAGFVKTVACMQHRTIPGQINFKTPNPDVPWDQIPFQVPTQSSPWPEPQAGRPRRAAVNAFGIGGLNVHVVIDDEPLESYKSQVQVSANLNGAAPRLKSDPDDRTVAIIGAATVLPGALTLDAYWDLLVSGRDPKSDIPNGRWNPEIYYDPQASGLRRSHSKRGGFVTDFVYDWKKHKVAPKQIANANPLQFMLLDAADQALRDAGYQQKAFDRQRAAVVVGSVYGGDFACDLQMGLRIPEFQKYLRDELRQRGVSESQIEIIAASYQQLLLKHMPALLDETGSFTASTLASRLTKTFDLMGGAFSLDASDTSSHAAVSAAMGMLQDGAVDLVVCAAGQRSMDFNVYESLQLRNNLARGETKPNFSADLDGVLPAEGAAVLILKRLSDAQRDGDHVRAVIRGFGVSIHLQDHGRSYRESLERAITSAQASPAAIGLVETASAGSCANDAAEADALHSVLVRGPRTSPAVVTSVTGQIGHGLGVSGHAAIAKAALELEHGQVPTTPHLTQPIPEITGRPETLQVATESRSLFATLPNGRALAAVSNSSLQGAVYTLILEGGQDLPVAPPRPVSTPATRVEWKTIRFAASTRAELICELRSALTQADPVFAKGRLPRFQHEAVRLAVVADSAATFSKRLHSAVEHLEKGGVVTALDHLGVVVREGQAERPQIAFVFPGQGSQYAGMLRELVEALPAAQAIAKDLDAVLARCGEASFADIAWTNGDKLGNDVFTTQLSMLLASTLLHRLLVQRGLKADVLAAHSYGEFSALVASGAVSLEHAIRATRERTDAVESRETTRGSLLSTNAPIEMIQRLLTHMPGAAYLASHNAPDQTVIGGTTDGILGVKRLLDAEGFATRVLAVPRPYHTPLLAECKDAFRQSLERIPFESPKTKLLSSVSLEFATSADAVRRNLVEQLTTPVRYVQLIERLADQGVTLFVEVGPSQVLTRLNQRILVHRTAEMVSSDLPKHSGMEALLRLEAQLEVMGVSRTQATIAATNGAAVRGEILFFDARQKRLGVANPPAIRKVVAAEGVAKPQAIAEVVSVPQPSALSPQPTLDPEAIAAFMVNFVVEQTGYPAEMVELEADLEADLGIDSIKKAQLIGELAENFSLTHLSGKLQDLSLDDFRTLRSLATFVTGSGAEGDANRQASEEVVVAEAPANRQATDVVESVSQPSALSPQPALDSDAIAAFMVNFVVEQTGYPAEMVELEADLEADLGIDSIKKAQLIGELAENFSLTHLSGKLQDLSLDDFRTLRSLATFVTGSGAEGDAKPQAIAEVAAVDQQPTTNDQPLALNPQPSTLDSEAIAAFMVNFVVEQTGYPAEMVELDADLEADLGIDSIKKAQLIGELAENFSLTHLSGKLQDLSLDDFRTLRSLATFVTGSGADDSANRQATVDVESVPQPSTLDPQPSTNTVEELPDAFSVVAITGSPYEMGFQHGRSQGPQIKAIMERYASMLGPRLQNIPELEEALADPMMYFGEDEIAELHGIADGAGLPEAAVIAHNLGMYPDYVPGCTQFAFTRRSNQAHGLVHAVNEDSPLSLTLPDCLARIVQVRRPTGGIAHVTFSVAGQTGGLNGINAAGLAISSTLLLDRPRRASTAIGKVHPVIVKRLLEQAATIEEAIALLKTMDRAGAWSLCISHHPTDRLCYLEYDGDTLQVQHGADRVLTTNHCLLQPPLADVPEHSNWRLKRLEQLLIGGDEPGVSIAAAKQILGDQFDLERGRQTTHATMNTIRRVDNQISIVMLPATGELYVTPGPRSRTLADKYFRLQLSDLLDHTHESAAAPSTNGLKAHVTERITISSPKPDARAGLPNENRRIVQRHVLRTVEQPLPSGSPSQPKWAGAALILGQNKWAEALKARLHANGVTVRQLSSTGDAEATVNELNGLWALQPATHLFIATGRDDVTGQDWNARRQTGLMTPYLVCQRWVQLVQEAKLTSAATLVGVTALGGDFGISGRIANVEGGGLTGLFKGIRRELSELTIKVIDAPAEESNDALVTAALEEAAQRGGPLEVGRVRGKRWIVQAVPQAASTQRESLRTPHGVWVVTGGARGVTAVVARELGRRFGLTMHLLGSTPEPQIDPSWRNLTADGLKALKKTIGEQALARKQAPATAWKEIERALEIDRTLQAFRAEGIAVHYHACDVSNREQLAATLGRIRQQDGAIHGIVHGAGLEAACKFEKKKRETVRATLAVKVDAAVWLAELTREDPLGWFVGFGSTSGRFGGLGQTDYSMASDLLCKFCTALRHQRPDVNAVGLHWPPWADVGMAARPESKIALQSSNLAFMPPLEGAAHVIDELLSQAGEGELLFLDKPDMIDTDCTMPEATTKAAYFSRTAQVKQAAIIDTIHGLQDGRSLLAHATFDPTQDPFLLEHRHHGLPILPAVVGMESLCEAATILANDGRQVVGVRKMTIHQGLRFHTDRAQKTRVQVQAVDGGYRGELQADFCDRHGRLVEPNRLQMDATIELAAGYAPLPTVDLGHEPTAWTTHKYVVDWRTMKFPEEARVYHGTPFRALQDYALVDGGLWAHLIVSPRAQIAGDRHAAGWQLPSATLDAGLLGTDLLVWNTLRLSNLPHAFDRIRFARPLVDGERLTLRVWLRGRSDRMIRADFVMVDAQGQVVVQVDGFEMVEVRSGMPTSSAATAETPQPVAAARNDSGNQVRPAPAPAPLPVRTMAPKVSTNGNGHRSAPAPAPLNGHAGQNGHSSNGHAKATAPTVAAERIAALPLIDAARWTSASELLADASFDPRRDPFLIQHEFSGRPLLPAVIGLETMIEAASLAATGKVFTGVKEFQIVSPLKFRDDARQSAQVRVMMHDGVAECQLVNAVGKDVILQTARIEFAAQPDPILAPTLVPPGFPYNPMMYAEKGQTQLWHGPLFRCLKALTLQRNSGWAKVTAAPANSLAGDRTGNWFLPVAALDSCLVACGVDLFVLMEQRVEIPFRIEDLRLARLPQPNEACTLLLHYRGSDDRHSTYDWVLYDAKSQPVLAIKGYRGIRTSKDADANIWNGASNYVDVDNTKD